MKIVSNLLSQLAKATDVQLRDFTANLNISQDTIVTLPEIPGAPEFWSVATGNKNNASFGLVHNVSFINSAAQIFPLCTLSRGLWKFDIHGTYNPGTVPVSFTITDGFKLNLRSPAPILADVALIWVLPDASSQSKLFQKTQYMLLAEDGWSLNGSLGLAGIGQTHGYAVSVVGSKFL